MSDEFTRIDELRRRYRTRLSSVEVGIGDDAALMRLPAGLTAFSVDTAVDGVHFRSDLFGPADIGYRAATTALSDLAAMGATPVAMLSALVLPQATTDTFLFAMADGIAQAAQQFNAPVIGGNLTSGRELSLTTTVMGHHAGAALLRSGARPGDGLYITGSVGEAAAGRELFLKRLATEQDALVQRYLRPAPHIQAGEALIHVAHACIDISDGLAQDVAHLCRASKVGCDIALSKVAVSEPMRAACEQLRLDSSALAICGGDDYVLAYAAEVSPEAERLGTQIGVFTQAHVRVRILDELGQEWSHPQAGYQHFGA